MGVYGGKEHESQHKSPKQKEVIDLQSSTQEIGIRSFAAPPESNSFRTIQRLANESGQVKHLRGYQQIANKSAHAQKAMQYHKIANDKKGTSSDQSTIQLKGEVIQRLSFMKGWGTDSWESYNTKLFGPWRDDEAGVLWGQIVKAYDALRATIGLLQANASVRDNRELEGISQMLNELDAEPIPFRIGQAVLERLQDPAHKDTFDAIRDRQEGRRVAERNRRSKVERAEQRKRERERQDEEYRAREAERLRARLEEEEAREQIRREEQRRIEAAWAEIDQLWAEQKDELHATTAERNLTYNWETDFEEFFSLPYANKRDQQPPKDAGSKFGRKQDRWASHSDDQERRHIIDGHVAQAIGAHLNEDVARRIGNEGKNLETSADEVQEQLDAALANQKHPPVGKWRAHLGMDQYVVQATEKTHEGYSIHITYDQNSVKQPGPIEDQTTDDLTDALLSVENTYRVHATLEVNQLENEEGDGYLNPHVYWGGQPAWQSNGQARYDGDRASAKEAMETALNEWVRENIIPKVQAAIDRAGDI